MTRSSTLAGRMAAFDNKSKNDAASTIPTTNRTMPSSSSSKKNDAMMQHRLNWAPTTSSGRRSKAVAGSNGKHDDVDDTERSYDDLSLASSSQSFTVGAMAPSSPLNHGELDHDSGPVVNYTHPQDRGFLLSWEAQQRAVIRERAKRHAARPLW